MNDSIFVGLDVHKATISVAVDGCVAVRLVTWEPSPIVPIRSPCWWKSLARWSAGKLLLRSGPCGYCLHRQLTEPGQDHIVVPPR